MRDDLRKRDRWGKTSVGERGAGHRPGIQAFTARRNLWPSADSSRAFPAVVGVSISPVEQTLASLNGFPVTGNQRIRLKFFKRRLADTACQDTDNRESEQSHKFWDRSLRGWFPSTRPIPCPDHTPSGNRVVYLIRRSTKVELAERTAVCLSICAFRKLL